MYPIFGCGPHFSVPHQNYVTLELALSYPPNTISIGNVNKIQHILFKPLTSNIIVLSIFLQIHYLGDDTTMKAVIDQSVIDQSDTAII